MPTAVAPTGNQAVDGILWGYKWDSLALTYSFPTSAAQYGGYSRIDGLEAFNSAQQAAVIRAVNFVNGYSGLNITLDANPSVASFRFAEADLIRYSANGPLRAPGGGTAEANPPDPTWIPGYAQGDAWFTKTQYDNPTIGSYADLTVMHEFGHALGLKHGHVLQNSYNGAATVTFPTMPSDQDSLEFTVMTYKSYPGAPTGSYRGPHYPQSFMASDIVALQYMYGPDFSVNNGNTTYTFSSTSGEMSINGVGQGATSGNFIFRTIWDGGGTDTYDFSNYSTNVSCNLSPGSYSTPSTTQLANLGDGRFARGSIFNSYQWGDSLIENATTGSGNDSVVGNAANNVIITNAGNDGVMGGAGNDTILGGAGTDTLLGESGNDAIAGGNDPDFILGGEGDDICFGGAGNDQIMGQGGNDVLWGEDNSGAAAGNDAIDGGADNDTILGQGGNDTIVGGDGNDAISGGDGVDLLYGGNGADIIFAGTGGDLILGGPGGDILRGEAGSDLFVFNFGDSADEIQDWNFGGNRDGIDFRPMYDVGGYSGFTAVADGVLAIYQNSTASDIYVFGAFTARLNNTVATALILDQSWVLIQ